jgi:hypothetical protein
MRDLFDRVKKAERRLRCRQASRRPLARFVDRWFGPNMPHSRATTPITA